MAKIAVVIPLFNEAEIVNALVTRLVDTTERLEHKFEYVFVDDGSTDATLERLFELKRLHANISIVSLSRNWGHQNAVNAGLDQVVNSDAVIMMDGDLEDPPEIIPELIDKWAEGNEVVLTVKRKRSGTILRRLLTVLYYRLLKAAVYIDVENQSGLYSLLDAKVLRHLKRFKERNKSYPNIRMFLGFQQGKVFYDREPRAHGKPRQSLAKLVQDGANALFSFSFLPVRLMLYVGLLSTVLFSAISILALFFRVTGVSAGIFQYIPGWTSSTILLMFFASLNILFLGIIGEYVARIFDEVRGRPYYIVDKIYPAHHDDT